ncbi:cell envelope integrity protein TolA [Halopseudomonas aestusnigri]|uniref:cell envelope integrity protein TolA n=1 Tax=Halopseudomonas aestusnigri TaxID=857252 RepID=UPI001E61E7FD|nr:cell envelope integrity protein TolA [Halopseudomonas aestusnigri]UGV31675.1 cell envelope integrity protein TolA [Halopseudomonas aestusnigri]
MSTRYQHRPTASERYSTPFLKAAGLHLAVAILLFASFSSAPEFEPAKPIVQATLVQLDSMSPAVTQTDQKIAGEAQKTAAPRHEEEAMEAQRQQQQAAEAARAAAAEKAREQAQAAAAAAERQAQAEAAAAAERRKVEEAKKAAEAEAARRAEAERKRAEEEARRKAQEEARRKAEAEAERKAAEAAEQRRREQERQANERRAQEEAKARALSELLAEETQYQMAQADRSGDQVAASYDDVIRRYVSQQWRRPPTARNGMVVEVQLSMLPTGQITDVVVTRSSGDAGFDQSAVQAVRNVGRIPEMQTLSRDNPAAFDRMYRQRTLRFKPEDLAF